MPSTDPANPPGRTEPDPEIAAAKTALRNRLRSLRRTPQGILSSVNRARNASGVSQTHDTFAVYASTETEPSSWTMIDVLYAAGHRILLPVLGPRPDGSARTEPDWAVYAGPDRLVPGYAGILEPTTPALGPDGVRQASLVWCAALAATRSGDRLGTGGGWYDRALAWADPDALVGVLLRDSEVLETVPTEAFDRQVHLIATESGVIRTAAHPEYGGDDAG